MAMVLGLLASLSLHLPVYGALGVLADKLLARAPTPRRAVTGGPGEEMEIFEPTAEDQELLVPFDVEEPEELPEAGDEGEPDERAERERERVREPEPPPEEPEPEPEEPEEQEQPRQPTPPVRPPENLQAVTQRSQNPNVEAPENARFIADENNQVEEETVAQMRNMVRDDPEPNPGEPQEESEAPEEGNADEQLVAEASEVESEDDRLLGPQQEPQETATAAEESGREGGEGDASGEARVEAQQGRQASSGGQTPEMETITVNDGFGTFTITRPRARAEGSGGGSAGGERRAGREARRESGGGAGGSGPNLQIGWSQFQAIVGEEQLAQEREEYVQARLSKQRGRSAHRRRRWREFRSAIENYVAQVRPGNQTALNAAASPFAGFISEVHRRLHVQYHQFLGGLPMDGPMSDMTLQTELEIIFRSDGTVDRIGVIHTSGVLTFDLGAFTAVMDAQPYPEPPRSILSPDDRVYMHWLFKRDSPFCHQTHASPYILAEAPNRPAPGSGGPGTRIPTGPAQGGLVPQGTAPNYGFGRSGDAEPREGDAQSDGDGDGERPGDAAGADGSEGEGTDDATEPAAGDATDDPEE